MRVNDTRLSARLLTAAVLTGAAAGVGGIVLTLLLRGIQRLAYGYWDDTFLVGVEQAAPGRRVLALLIGGTVVGFGWWALRRKYRSIASPEQLLRHPNRQSPFTAVLADTALQMTAVGAGASLGREGAPRQLAAACAGRIADLFKLPAPGRRLLIACGAGAGLAAVYNVPIGGAVFTLEVLLASVSAVEAVPALLTSAVATVVAWPIVTRAPVYLIAAQTFSWSILVWAIPLGIVAGLLGSGFNRLTGWARSLAPTGWRVPVAIIVVFTLLGVLSIPYPELLGNGKGPAQLAFGGATSLGLFAVLGLLKPVTTASCLGAGASGGLLTPALATGAMLGAVTGGAWSMIWPGSSTAAFALVGAAAFVATTQRAPLTAVVLILEFTHTGLDLVVPLLIAVSLASMTAQAIGKGHARQTDLPTRR